MTNIEYLSSQAIQYFLTFWLSRGGRFFCLFHKCFYQNQARRICYFPWFKCLYLSFCKCNTRRKKSTQLIKRCIIFNLMEGEKNVREHLFLLGPKQTPTKSPPAYQHAWRPSDHQPCRVEGCRIELNWSGDLITEAHAINARETDAGAQENVV